MTEPPLPTPGPPPAPAAPPRRWGRRLLLAAGAAVLLLGVLAACLPAFASSRYVRRRIESSASETSGRRVTIEAIEAGWSSTRVRGIEVRSGPGAGDSILLRVEEVVAAPGIGALLRGNYDVPRLEVLRPVVRIDLRALRFAAKDPAALGAPKGAATGGGSRGEADPAPPFSVELRVREGTLLLVDDSGAEHRVGTFSAEISASRDGPARVALHLVPAGGGRIEALASGTPFAGGRPVGRDAMEAEGSLRVEGIDLAVLSPALGGLLPLEECRGKTTAEVRGRLALGSVEDGTLHVEGKGLLLGGGPLGPGARLEEPSLTVDGSFRLGREGSVEVRGGKVEAAGVSLRADGAWLRGTGWNGTFGGRAGLDTLTARARSLRRPVQGGLSGTLFVEGYAAAEGGAQRLTANARVEELQVLPGNGRAPFFEPITTLEVDLLRKGDSVRVDILEAHSTWIGGSCKGTVSMAKDGECDLALRAEARLGPLVTFARALGMAPPGDVEGTAAVEATVKRHAGAGAAVGTLTVRNLVVTPPGAGRTPVKESLLKGTFDAAFAGEGTTVRALSVQGGLVRATGSGSVAGDGGGSLDLDARAEVAPLLDVLRSFGVAVGAEAAGTVAWKGPVSWTPGAKEVAAKGDIRASGLVVRIPAGKDSPAREVRETGTVRLALDGQRRGDGWIEAAVRLEADGIAVTSKRVAWSPDGTVDAVAEFRLGLGPLFARAAALGFVPRDPAVSGTLACAEARVSGKPEALSLAIKDLVAEGAPFDLAAGGSFAVGGAADLALIAGGDLAAILDLAAGAGWIEPAGETGGRLSIVARAEAGSADSPLRVGAAAGVRGLRHRGAAGGKPWTQESAKATLAGTWDRKNSAAEGTVAVAADDGTIDARGKGSLAAGSRSVEVTKVDVDFDLSGLCRARPSLVPVKGLVAGRLKGSASVRGPLAEPVDWSALGGTARFTLDRVETRPFEAKEIAVDALLQGGVVAARAVTATVNGGPVSAKGTLGLADRDHRHTLEVHASKVAVDRALGDLLGQVVPIFAVSEAGAVEGTLRLDLKLEGEGAEWARVKGNLRGGGLLAVDDGRVAENGTLGRVLEFLGRGGEGAFAYRTISTEFAVHDGRVWNERLLVDGKEHAMALQGSTTFEGKLDYSIGARALNMGKKKRERLAPILDADGNLPFRLGGTLSKPKLKPPDLEKVLGKAAEDALEKRLKELLGGKDD